MIEDSIHSGKYPMDKDIEKQTANHVQVLNRSSFDDLMEKDLRSKIKGFLRIEQLCSKYTTSTGSN
jgi:hypothetical protein